MCVATAGLDAQGKRSGKQMIMREELQVSVTFILGFVDVACLPNSAQYAFHNGLPMHSHGISVLPPHSSLHHAL